MKIGKIAFAMAAVAASFVAQAATIKYSVIETSSGKEAVIMSGTTRIDSAPLSVSNGVSTPYAKSYPPKNKELPTSEKLSREEGARPISKAPAFNGEWPDVISDCFPAPPTAPVKQAPEMGEAFNGVRLVIKKTEDPSIFEIDFKKYDVSWVTFSMPEMSSEAWRLPTTHIQGVADRQKLDIGVKNVVFDSAAVMEKKTPSVKDTGKDVRVEITRLD